MITVNKINEQRAANAFNRQAKNFDSIYGSNSIIQYKRERVYDHIERFIISNASILELNAGTGEDAIWFAKHGHKVHATDISGNMLEVLQKKVAGAGLNNRISSEVCSYSSLDKIRKPEKFDLIFSNFGGLNCTGDLDLVLSSFNSLLKPGGMVTLVIMPGFCLWETILLFRGKFKTAFRRFFSKHGRKARINNAYFKCWYYNPSFIKKHLGREFELLGMEGLCTIVPPSYLENFQGKYPSTFAFLKKKEESLKEKWPWKLIGDYYIISFKKLPEND